MLRLRQSIMAPLRMCWNCSVGLVAGRWEQVEGIGAGPGGELLSLGELLQTLADVSFRAPLCIGAVMDTLSKQQCHVKSNQQPEWNVSSMVRWHRLSPQNVELSAGARARDFR
jgi:hypothetical protein